MKKVLKISLEFVNDKYFNSEKKDLFKTSNTWGYIEKGMYDVIWCKYGP